MIETMRNVQIRTESTKAAATKRAALRAAGGGSCRNAATAMRKSTLAMGAGARMSTSTLVYGPRWLTTMGTTEARKPSSVQRRESRQWVGASAPSTVKIAAYAIMAFPTIFRKANGRNAGMVMSKPTE